MVRCEGFNALSNLDITASAPLGAFGRDRVDAAGEFQNNLESAALGAKNALLMR
jgi:hypothetical protein